MNWGKDRNVKKKKKVKIKKFCESMKLSSVIFVEIINFYKILIILSFLIRFSDLELYHFGGSIFYVFKVSKNYLKPEIFYFNIHLSFNLDIISLNNDRKK